MTSVELIKQGRLEDALTALQSEIRNHPEDVRLRIFLFQLNCALGRLEKALTQLDVIASLNAETMMLAHIFRPVILCEQLRRDVFAGKRTPMVFGEPMEWVGMLVQANAHLAQENYEAAADLRSQAFEQAPTTAGSFNGTSFEWIADADSRFGPVLEVILDGKYFWVPFNRISRIEIEKPNDLRDLIWTPARFTWSNGGAVSAHIPARYPGTENSTDDALRLARKTDWINKPGDTVLGLGQRLLATDAAEYPLLECRSLELKTTA